MSVAEEWVNIRHGAKLKIFYPALQLDIGLKLAFIWKQLKQIQGETGGDPGPGQQLIAL